MESAHGLKAKHRRSITHSSEVSAIEVGPHGTLVEALELADNQIVFRAKYGVVGEYGKHLGLVRHIGCTNLLTERVPRDIRIVARDNAIGDADATTDI